MVFIKGQTLNTYKAIHTHARTHTHTHTQANTKNKAVLLLKILQYLDSNIQVNQP